MEIRDEQAANALMNEILDDVSGKLVDGWHHCLRTVNGKPECSCIYYYTERSVSDETKRVKFYVKEDGSRVTFQQIWRQGYTPGKMMKVDLAAKLMDMLVSRFYGKFESAHFVW